MANPFLVLGGIAVGIITAGFGILQVPGWVASAQDAAAINDLGSAAIGQASSSSQGHGYKAGGAFGEFAAESGVKVALSDGVKLCVTTNTDHTEYAAVALSASGKFFARSTSTAKAVEGETAAEAIAKLPGGLPAGVPAPFNGVDCATPGAEVPGGSTATGPTTPETPTIPAGADAVFTLRCDVTTEVRFPLGGASGTPTWADGEPTDIGSYPWPSGHPYDGVKPRTLVAGQTYTLSFEGTFGLLGGIGYSDAPYFNQDMWDCFRSMDAWSEDAGTTQAVNAFRDMRNLTSVTAVLPRSVMVTEGMFQNATSFNDPDVIGWNVSNLVFMGDMFNGATAFDQDLSGWDVNGPGPRFAPHLAPEKQPAFN